MVKRRVVAAEEDFLAHLGVITDTPANLPMSRQQLKAQSMVFSPAPPADAAFGQVRVAQPYTLTVFGRESQFRLVWLKRAKAQDVFIHCERTDNSGVSATNSAVAVREHMTQIGVPSDALWFEVSSRNDAMNQELFNIVGRSYVMFPVKFQGDGHACWGPWITFEAIEKRLGLSAKHLEALCDLY